MYYELNLSSQFTQVEREQQTSMCVYARVYRQYQFHNDSFIENEELRAVKRDANTEMSRFLAQQRLQV